METQSPIVADWGPLPARVPASVQQLLLEATVIPDWNLGMNSLACEWVEHRHWDFSTTIAAETLPVNERIILDAPGLDYSGWILVDCVEQARFEGALVPHRFDLTNALGDGKAHQLSIVFEEPPREQGQMGYTSLSRFFKPRYTYSWDWCPRIVPIGPWQSMQLLTGPDAACELHAVSASLSEDFVVGTVRVQLFSEEVSGLTAFRAVLRDGDTCLAVAETNAQTGVLRLILEAKSISPWQPNGSGAQHCYCVEVQALDGATNVVWQTQRQVGFRHVAWHACEGAPTDAEPWLCVINGVPTFLQGANWVPPKAVYHDLTSEDYERLLLLYRDMGANLLRVWGGGILERPEFYELCDQLGILVWQELPLSSSGVENCPPDDVAAIEQLRQIAEYYVRARGHHASLLLWSGGNELTWGGPDEKTGILPVDERHPCIAALRQTLAQLDPDHRFIATSPTGPRFYAQPDEYGQGLHHDIHGPWGLASFAGANFDEKLASWRVYWAPDDALFRSEAGMPGAASLECIQRYADPDRVWPPVGPYWMHTAAWWTQWDWCKKSGVGQGDKAALQDYVVKTQAAQAAAYAIAARRCKERFPKCGGFIIWMGHDCFPCPSNNSVIDFLGLPKPAYTALQQVFQS